jgi:hypothetical protein
MVRFKKKFIFFKISEIWFGNSFKLFDLIGLNVFLHIKDNKTKIFGVRYSTYTIENRLDEPAETIFSKFSKTVKVEIKQAEKKNITCFFHNDLEKFAKFYNDFAMERRINLLNVCRLYEMRNCIKLSYAVIGNEEIAGHSYLVDEELGIVRLMHSASRRLDDQFDKQLSARINKYLHYKDMLYFREKGFKIYDFGGYANNTSDIGLQGINRFKLSFGGEVIKCNNYASFSYYVIKKIALLFRLINKS